MSNNQIEHTQEIVVTRIIDAPPALVWRAWTEPELFKRWWGPKDYSSPVCEIDLRVGGKYLFCMRAPKEQGGQDSYNTGVYTHIVPLERLEFSQSLSDKDGNPIDPSEIGMPEDFPKELKMVVLFKSIKGGEMTELSVTQSNWTMGQMSVYALAGLHQTVDKLIESLK